MLNGSNLKIGSVPRLREDKARWYAVHTLPGKEDLAQGHLARQGYRAFLPRQKRTVRHARKITVRSAAFFPNYLFVYLNVSVDRWRPINGTTGVRSMVTQGERPAPCPFGLVERLIDLTDQDGLLDLTHTLSIGKPVRILAGPFADLVGELERLDSGTRARVLVQLLNSQVFASVDLTNLIAA